MCLMPHHSINSGSPLSAVLLHGNHGTIKHNFGQIFGLTKSLIILSKVLKYLVLKKKKKNSYF